VSETIQKLPLTEAQTALGKLFKNTFCGLWVPLTKFCEKTASPQKISLKMGNQLPSCGQTTFNMVAVRHLEFKRIHI